MTTTTSTEIIIDGITYSSPQAVWRVFGGGEGVDPVDVLCSNGFGDLSDYQRQSAEKAAIRMRDDAQELYELSDEDAETVHATILPLLEAAEDELAARGGDREPRQTYALNA